MKTVDTGKTAIVSEYRPHKLNNVGACILIVMSVISLVLFGHLLHDFKIDSILLLVVAAIFIVFAKELYQSSKLLFIIETNGLRIIGDKNKGHIFVPWDELKYAYRFLTIHGHRFWVFSAEPVDEKKAKRVINTISMSAIFCDNMIILPEKLTDKDNFIKSQIVNRIPNVIDKYM